MREKDADALFFGGCSVAVDQYAESIHTLPGRRVVALISSGIVEGKLQITDEDLTWRPGQMARFIGMSPIRLSREDVQFVATHPAAGMVNSERIQVRLASGKEIWFTAGRRDAIREAIDRWSNR